MGLTRFFHNYYTALRCNYSSYQHILRIQNRRLRNLLLYATQNSEFYRDLYDGIDVVHCRLGDLPVITKSAMMDNFDRLVTDSGIKLQKIQEWTAEKNNFGKMYDGKFLPVPSSGSTGNYALVVYDRRAVDIIQSGLLARHPLLNRTSLFTHLKMLVMQLLGHKTRIAIMTAPRGNIAFFAKNAPPFHRRFGELKFLSTLDPIEEIVATLNEFKPDGLSANSFLLPILAQEQLAGSLNIKFDRPTSFLVGAAEPLTEHTRGLALKAWNMNIQNDYGASECFFMATSCQQFGQLHAMSDLCILEAVDENYKPVPPGQCGEKILVTNLANSVQPIIRYEIEDIVGYAGQPCKCGLPFPTLLPMQGRKFDYLYFQKPQGGYERIHPYRLTVSLYYLHELKQYQIIQTKRNELTFIYVPQSDESKIEKQLQQTLENDLRNAGLESRVRLKLKRVEAISRDHQSGKYKVVNSLPGPPDIDSVLDTHPY